MEMLMSTTDDDTTNGHFNSVKKWLGYIMVRGDKDELFFCYGYNKEKSMVLFPSCKQALPNIFQGTSFKKHNQMLPSSNDDFSIFFFICQVLQIERRKLTNLETMFSFI